MSGDSIYLGPPEVPQKPGANQAFVLSGENKVCVRSCFVLNEAFDVIAWLLFPINQTVRFLNSLHRHLI